MNVKNKNLLALFFDLLEKVIGKTKTGNVRMACIDFVCFLCLNPENKTKKKFKTIKHCFTKHKESFDGKIKFTRYQYTEFWLTHQIGDVYSMASRDGSIVACKVAYYPMADYNDLRALIEVVDLNAGTEFAKDEKRTDFREVPIHYLIRTTLAEIEKEITQNFKPPTVEEAKKALDKKINKKKKPAI